MASQPQPPAVRLQRWEVLAVGRDGLEVVVAVGDLALKESGAVAFNVPGRGWQTVFSPGGWLRANQLDG